VILVERSEFKTQQKSIEGVHRKNFDHRSRAATQSLQANYALHALSAVVLVLGLALIQYRKQSLGLQLDYCSCFDVVPF